MQSDSRMEDTLETEMFRDSVRRTIADRRPTRWSSAGRTGRSDPARWRELIASGWLLAGLPEAAGGFGGAVEFAALMEELGRGLLTEPALATMIALQPLAHAGSAGATALIERVLEGRGKLAFAYAEPGHDAGSWGKRTVLAAESGGLRLRGLKHVVLGGGDADYFVVVADDQGAPTALIVPADAAGVDVQDYVLVDGSGAADVRFDLLLDPGARLAIAPDILDRTLDLATLAVCAQGVGAMAAAFDMTLEYVKQRVQFGHPIGTNQVVQHRLVDMLRLLRQAEIMTGDAARSFVGDDTARTIAISAAKVQLSTSARMIGQQAVQLHGAIGTTDEAMISHYFRALIALPMLFGDADFHRRRFARLEAAHRPASFAA